MSELQNLESAALERLQRLGGDAFVAKMIELFLDYGAQKVAAARQAQDAGNFRALEDAAHPLKSSAGNVGARRMQDLAVRIEQLAKQQQADNLAGLVAELEDAFAAVSAELVQKKSALSGQPTKTEANPGV